MSVYYCNCTFFVVVVAVVCNDPFQSYEVRDSILLFTFFPVYCVLKSFCVPTNDLLTFYWK